MSHANSPYISSVPSTRPTSTAHASAPFSAPQPARAPSLSPETLDIVPALYEILNRTLPPVPGATGGQTGAAQPAFPGQQPLDINQLNGEVSSIRARIRKARREIESLPGVERTVEEQEDEIAYLREKVRKQVEVLEGLRVKGED